MTEKSIDLNILDINPVRCDLATHCDMSVRVQRQERRLNQNPGITIKTDAEKVAEIVTGIPKNSRWEIAVGKAVVLIGGFTKTETPDVVGNSITTLFDGLRDPDRRAQTMQRVEVLYEERVSTTRR